EGFDKIMHTNLLSNVWLSNMTLPAMAQRKDGALIVVSSVGGFVGSAMLGAYCLSKAADMQLARNLAVEWGPHNIRVNCIAPGIIRTSFSRSLWADPARAAAFAPANPLRRLRDPDDAAGLAVLRASPDCPFITGPALTARRFCLPGGGGSPTSPAVGGNAFRGAEGRGPWPRWASDQSIRPVLKRPLLQEELAAVITTRLMRPAAAGTRSFSNTNTKGLTLGLSSFHGTSAMITMSAPM